MIPAVIVAILLATVASRAIGGNEAPGNAMSTQGQSSEPYQQPIVPIEDSQQNITNEIVGSWSGGFGTLDIQSDLTFHYFDMNTDDFKGHIKIISNSQFQLICPNSAIADQKLSVGEDNTIVWITPPEWAGGPNSIIFHKDK
jgi:hypothetical protein